MESLLVWGYCIDESDVVGIIDKDIDLEEIFEEMCELDNKYQFPGITSQLISCWHDSKKSGGMEHRLILGVILDKGSADYSGILQLTSNVDDLEGQPILDAFISKYPEFQKLRRKFYFIYEKRI